MRTSNMGSFCRFYQYFTILGTCPVYKAGTSVPLQAKDFYVCFYQTIWCIFVLADPDILKVDFFCADKTLVLKFCARKSAKNH